MKARAAVAGPAPDDVAPLLLRWFDRHRRDLPWRRRPSAYRTLVSELMLQQTVVATVVPYFERFVARFPDLRALAAASEEEVLALWSGLGYYARGRNLRRAAIAVVERHGGELPSDEEALRALPGVGPYTAAAVAAIAFDRRTFALDGNGARVMARLYAVRDPVDRPAVRERLRVLGAALVPAARAGDFNQAVMELGALVCAPGGPRCEACPLRAACAGAAAGIAAELPVKKPRAARRAARVACALVTRAGRVLLVRRQAGELFAGTWTLPSVEIAGAASDRAAGAAARAAAARQGIAAGRPRPLGRVSHVLTHRDLTADVFAVAELRPGAQAAAARDGARRWADPRALDGLGVSSFTRKTLATVLDPRAPKRDKRPVRP
jgi:A/G-specific adenine glycosylase